MQQNQAQLRSSGILGSGFYRLGPILVCEQGAKLRGLDLEVAATDAKHWWKTGFVPLRATPLAINRQTKKEKAEIKPKPKAITTKEAKPKGSAPKKVKPIIKETILEKEMKSEPKQLKPEKREQNNARPQTAAKSEKQLISPQQIWLAIANLNIFAFGYFLAGQKKRWYYFLGGGLLLLLVAQISNASKHPLLWTMIFLSFFIAMAADLWLLLKKTPPTPPQLIQKTAHLLPIAALLINILFYSGFFLYRWSGNCLYKAGLAAQEENDLYATFGNWYALSSYYRLSLNPRAIEVQKPLGEVALLINSHHLVESGEFSASLDAIDRFNTLYPASTRKSQMADISVDAYLGWAHELAGQNKYKAGLDRIYDAVNYFPTQTEARQEDIDAAFSAHYMAWGSYLSGQEDFASAVEKYEYLLSNYPQSIEVQDAYEAAAQAYIDWSAQLTEQEEYVQAALNLDTVLDTYRLSAAVTDARQMMPVAYLNSGIQLSTQSHYLLAMERLETAKKLGLSSTQAKNADNEYQKTIQLLARDDGEDGQKVLDEALAQSCTGEIPSHPSVGILVDEPGKVLNCCYVPGVSNCSRWSMSSDLVATTPGSFRYTVLRSSDSRKVQSCAFSGRHILERLQDMAEVTITSVATGELVAKNTFYGGTPKACPMVYFFNYSTASIMGDFISNPTIDEWIAQVLQ